MDTPTLLSSPLTSQSPHARATDSRTARIPFQDDAWALGTLLLLCMVVALIWMPYSLYRLDNLSFYYPWYSELGQRLRSLDIPGWLPTTMSGVPMAADPQSGWGYLPAMVIMTLTPSLTGFKLFILFHIVFAAVSSYLYARNLGISPLGALTTGVAFTLGNFLERTSCCTIHMQVAVWIPAVFLCIDRSQRASNRTGRIGWLMLAGLGASQIVCGWIGQGAYYGGLAVGFYLLYRFVIAPVKAELVRQRVGWFLLGGLVIGVIAGAIASPAVLPRLDVISRSNLADLYDDGAGVQSNPGWSIALLAERVAGPQVREGRWYLGVVMLALAVMAPILLGRRRHVVFFSLYTVAVLSLIIRDSPLTWLFNVLPEFESLHSHSPDRVYVVLFIGPAVLAGSVVDALTSRRWTPPGTWRAVAAVEAPVVLIVSALILVKAVDNSWLPTSRVLLTVATCLIVGVALASKNTRVARICAVAVILLLVIDPTGRLAYRRLDGDNRTSTENVVEGNTSATGAVRWLQERQAESEIFRFFGYDVGAMTAGLERYTYTVGHYRPTTASLLINNRAIHLGLEDIQGYNPVQIQRYVNYMRALNGQRQSYHTANVLENGLDSPLLDLLNVRYIVIPATMPVGRPDLFHLMQEYPTVYLDDTNRILENPDAMPRAWVVHEAVTTRTGKILDSFIQGDADPATTALLDTKVPELEPLASGETDSVEITYRDNDEIRLRVTTSAPGMVILSEIWDPGWSATMDGRSARVYRANYVFRGVLVDEGTSEIVLRYDPPHIRWTLALYLVPLVGFAALGVVSLRTRRLGPDRSREPVTAIVQTGLWSDESGFRALPNLPDEDTDSTTDRDGKPLST